MSTTPPVPQPTQPTQPVATNGATVSNTPATAAQQTDPSQQQANPATTATSAPDATQQPQPAQAQSSMVSNAPAQHPSVQRASIIHEIAQSLAGGPRYATSVDANTGTITKTQVPLSKSDIGMAIAMEALSGSIAGLAQIGPGATGKAAAAGYQQVSQEQQDAQKLQDQQTQQNLKNQTSALARQGAAHEQNSRTVLNTAQAERLGVESLKDAASQNSDLLKSYDDAGEVQERNISQDQLMAGMKFGKYSSTQQIAVPDGFTDINGKYEQTFAIVQNPSAKIPLTQAQWDEFAAAGVQGFPKGTKIPEGYTVPGTLIASANQKMQANQQMEQEAGTVADALSKSKDTGNQELAQSIPDFKKLLSDPQTGPTLQNALSKFQKYISHSDMHGMDLYQSLQQMAAPSKPDPNNPKQFIPNQDSSLANTIAGAFGGNDPKKGWQILKAYSDEQQPTPIKNVAQAENILTDHTSSAQEKSDANSFLAIDQKRVDAEAAAKKGASGGKGGSPLGVASLTPQEYSSIIDGIGHYQLDASQMLRYGKADQLKILADVKGKYPNYDATKYAANLGLQKWAESGKGADQIQSLNTLHGHTQDFVENMHELGNLDSSLLNTPINKLKRMSGNPQIVALVGRMLAPRTEYMNLLNNGHALTVEDKADAQKLLNENMSPSQMLSAMQQINGTADIRGSQTNARYRSVFGQDMPNYTAPAGKPGNGQGGQPRVVPAGAIPGRNAAGQIIGYKLPNGQTVRF